MMVNAYYRTILLGSHYVFLTEALVHECFTCGYTINHVSFIIPGPFNC